MRVLVTGGAGYIGSHACKALTAAGHLPIVYDNLSQGHRWAVRYGPLEEGDVADAARLDAVMKAYRPEAIMHFAALTSVGRSVAEPELYYANNVGGTVTLLTAARVAGVDRFVFSSSCAVHGTPPATPITEDMPFAPLSPYGRSKLIVEQVLSDCAAATGMKAVALRYFNASGADPSGELGEAHDPETHLVPLALTAARFGTPLTLNGDDYDTPDGTCVRDYIHVSDLAEAHVLALDALNAKGQLRAYNLGTGKGLSVREIVKAAKAATGRDIAVKVGPRRPGDPPVLYADPSRAAKELGFTATRSAPKTILESAWNWMTRPPAYAAA